MASTYTDNNGFEKIGNGEQSGSWGTTTNTNFDLLDEALDGQVRVTLTTAGTTGSPNDIDMSDGLTSEGRHRWIEVYSASDLGANIYVRLAPNNSEKIVFFRNSLNSSRSVVVFQGTYSAPNSVTIANGEDAILKFDGAGAGAVVEKVQKNLSVTSLTDGTATLTGGALTGVSLTSPTITSPTITGANATITSGTITGITGSGTWTLTSDVVHNDGVKAYFGSGSDMQVYYSGGNGFVQAAAGDVRVIGNNVRVQGATVTLTNEAASETMALFTENAGVDLYYNDIVRLSTINTGISVTGVINSSGAITGTDITASGAVSAASFTGAGFLDEDTMSSNSATKVASQQSIKAYVDTEIFDAIAFGGFTSGSTLSGNTSWTMTGIDSSFNHVQVQFDDVSLSGTANILVQFTVASTPVTSGYVSSGSAVGTSSQNTISATTGFIINAGAASNSNSGTLLLSKFSGTGSAVWVGGGTFYPSSSFTTMVAGRSAPGGIIDGIRVITSNGTDTFDSGRISMRFWK